MDGVLGHGRHCKPFLAHRAGHGRNPVGTHGVLGAHRPQMEDTKVVDHGKVQKAMALRVKYRVDQASPKRRFAIQNLGVHFMNRGGHEVYPNGNDVRRLGLEILSSYMDHAEANHNGVVVEEVPADVQAAPGFKDPVKAAVAADYSYGKATYEGIGHYNYRMCNGSDYLGSCFTEDQARGVVAGTLSHSHLLLVLLSMAKGGEWKVTDADGTFTFPCNRSGYIDTAAVAARDEMLKRILAEGLDMELLSYKIYIEEPSACVLISNALNHAQKLALKTTELAALSALSGAVGLSAVAGKVNFTSVRESLRATLDVMVDEPEFVEMFDFVVRMGADKNSYLPEFLKFTSKCVSSQFRRIRLQTFAVLNKFKAGPLSKVALCKRSLRSKPGAGGMCPTPEPALEKRSEYEFQHLEDVLLYFHTDCQAAVAAVIPDGERSLFFANIDVAAADAWVKTDATDTRRSTMDYKNNLVSATAKYWHQLHVKVKAGGGRKVPQIKDKVGNLFPTFQTMMDEAEKAAHASAVADTTKFAEPVLIRYNESTSTSSYAPELRASVVAATERTRLPCTEWLTSKVAITVGLSTAAESVGQVALQTLHRAACVQAALEKEKGVASGIDVFWDPKEKATVVVTTSPAAKGSIELMPCIPMHKLRTESTHPARVLVTVREKTQGIDGPKFEFYAHPEWDAPADKTVASSAVAEDTATSSAVAEHRTWAWGGKESMHPHWAVRRLTDDDLRVKLPGASFNMVQKTMEFSQVCVGGSDSMTFLIQVPCLTNDVDLATGVELVCRSIGKPAKDDKKKPATWKDDQKCKERKDAQELKKRKLDTVTTEEV
jgi:hypothetical protein